MSPTDAKLVERVREAELPMDVVPFNHEYDSVGVPPSASVAVARQSNVDVAPIPVDGVIVTADRTGAVLSMVTRCCAVAVPPCTSDAVARQITSSPGLTNVGVNVNEEPIPIPVPAAETQTYDSDGVPPSASVAVAEHVSVVDVVTPVGGVMFTVTTVGSVFEMVTLVDASSNKPLGSVTRASQ